MYRNWFRRKTEFKLVKLNLSLTLCCILLKQRYLGYIHIYMSIIQTRWIFPKELAVGSTVYSSTFFRKLLVIGPFMTQNTVSMTFFTDCYSQNFFFSWESVCVPLYGLSFQLVVANPCLVQRILLCTYIQSYVNFKWFVLLSHQKFHDWPLFEAVTRSFIFNYFE